MYGDIASAPFRWTVSAEAGVLMHTKKTSTPHLPGQEAP